MVGCCCGQTAEPTTLKCRPSQPNIVRWGIVEWGEGQKKDQTDLVPIGTIPPPREIPHHLCHAPNYPVQSRKDGVLADNTLMKVYVVPSPNVFGSSVLLVVYDLDPPCRRVWRDGNYASVT